MAEDAESWNSTKNAGGSASSSGTSSPWSSAPEATLSPSPSASGARFSPPPLSSPRLKCAVCRYQNKKCEPGCLFLPHLPGDQMETFRKVQRLFGVNNMRKLMEKVEPSDHEILMRTLKCEADAWVLHPVHGVLGVIRDQEAQLRNAFIELAAVHLKIRECVARAEQQMRVAQQPAAQEPNMVIPHAATAAAAQHYDNRSTAQYSGTARGVTQGLEHLRQHQMTGARQAPAGSEVARDLSMAMSNAAAASQNDCNHNHPAAQYDGTALRVTHAHGHPSQHQTTVQQMSVGHQAAAAVEDAREQIFQAADNAHAVPGSNSGVGMASAPLGSAGAGAFVFQQQPPSPPPVQSGTAPRYQQEHTSAPPSP